MTTASPEIQFNLSDIVAMARDIERTQCIKAVTLWGIERPWAEAVVEQIVAVLRGREGR